MSPESFKSESENIDALQADVAAKERDLEEAKENAKKAHDGLFTGETTEDMLHGAYRAEADAELALKTAKEKIESSK